LEARSRFVPLWFYPLDVVRLAVNLRVSSRMALTHQEAQANSNLIVPGRSVGPVQLGDTRERALEVFGAVFGNRNFSEENDCLH